MSEARGTPPRTSTPVCIFLDFRSLPEQPCKAKIAYKVISAVEWDSEVFLLVLQENANNHHPRGAKEVLCSGAGWL